MEPECDTGAIEPGDYSTGIRSYPKFKITEFTQNPSELLKEIKKRLYTNFLPEKTFPFEKVQRNFLY
jgi:hypothetical protein